MSNFKLFYTLTVSSKWNPNLETVYLKKPVLVGLVETDKESRAKSDPNIIRYFKLPKAQDYPLDLNAGDDYRYRSEGYFKNNMHKVTRYLIDHHGDVDKGTAESETEDKETYDIISSRGALAELLMTPLQIGTRKKYEWTLYVTYFNKKMYIFEKKTDDAVRSPYHFKFAQHCFSDDPNNDPDMSAPIHEDEQMYCIYKSKMKNFNLFYSAEINGILSDKKLENVHNLEELNKCRFVYTKLMKKSILNWQKNFRIQNWWAKCYFSAVNDVYVGFRDDLGFVNDPVRHIVMHELVREQQWSPKVCSSFLYKILSEIYNKVKGNSCPFTTYEFHFDSSNFCIEVRKHEGKTEKSFLTDEYIEHVNKNSC